MKKNRIFTDEELKAMGTRTLDVVKEAIDAGDKDKAKAMAQRMYDEFKFLHDGYMFWTSGLLTYIYKNFGIDAVEEAEREAHTIEARAVFKPLEKTDTRFVVEHTAKAMRGHMQPVVVNEDDEKITLEMKPCGSGERIIQYGGYEPEIGLVKIKEPHKITWGMKDFPIYCVHCPVMEMLEIENTGHFNVVKSVSDPLCQDSCMFNIYKDPADIPEECYTRAGKTKPAKSDTGIS
jgi:hypothetical protein